MAQATKIDMKALPDLVAAGLTTRQIADRFEVKNPAVVRACYRLGISLPSDGRPNAKPAPKPTGHPPATRADDERALRMLKLKRQGYTDSQIGRRIGSPAESVKVMRCKILKDDLAESCPHEREADVRRHYRK